VVALGTDVAGLMSNNQPWADRVLDAARSVGEPLWQLPMFSLYADLIRSDVADIKNTGGRFGGAIAAAKFLENFVAGLPWVHLDIAGPAFAEKDCAWRDGGGSGCFVRTLVEVARKYNS
jgi:leucyl aminopeptidase